MRSGGTSGGGFAREAPPLALGAALHVARRGREPPPHPPRPVVLHGGDEERKGLGGMVGSAGAHYSEYWLRACFQEHAQQLLCTRRGASVATRPRGDDPPPAELIARQCLEQLRRRGRTPLSANGVSYIQIQMQIESLHTRQDETEEMP